MEGVGTFDLVPILGRGHQAVRHMYPLDNKDTAIQYHLAARITYQPIQADSYLTCLQRTAEGPGQSAGSGGDDIIECRCMGFRDVRGNSIVGGDRSVDSEQDRVLFRREIRPAQGSFYPLDPYL
jgi:hypothetical protein